MNLGKPSGGYWLFWVTAFYVEAVVINYGLDKPVMTELIQLAWIVIISLPLWVPPLARFLNMKCVWEM